MDVASLLSGKKGKILTIAPDCSIAEAADILRKNRIGALIVQHESGDLAGILSERDIVRGLSMQGAAILAQPAKAMMTAKVEVCRRAEPIRDIMRRMTQGRFRHMPVVEDGDLVGIISIGDVVNSRMRELEQETSAMRDYIMSS